MKYQEEIHLGIKIRLVEQKLLELFKQGKINGTVHTCVGQEMNAVFIAKHSQEEDYFFSNHRGHGHYLSKTSDYYGLFAELMGRKDGACHGIGGSQHLYNKNYLSNGIQGGMTPIAAGVAKHYKDSGSSGVSVVFIGDGTLGEGIIYEVMNICSLWKLPILFVLENNQYAQSTSHKETFAGNIKKRVEGFGLKFLDTSIWNLKDLDKQVAESFKHARSNEPTLLKIDCYRLNSHSKGDDNRDINEVEEYREKDPINIYESEYRDEFEVILANYSKEIDNSVSQAEASEELIHFDNFPQYVNLFTEFSPLEPFDNDTKYNERIYNSLGRVLAGGSAYIIGEDIKNHSEFTSQPYGGAFKVTRDLSDKFPTQVYNTPISEAAITGITVGLAIMGNYSITEIMFGDFSTLILDQLLQHASKFYGMTMGNVKVPMVVRTPMGGYRGYGPTHSQSIEKFFLGIPHLGLIVLNKYLDPDKVYLKKEETPRMVIENKVLYTQNSQTKLKKFEYRISNETYPTIKISPKSRHRDCLVVGYGGLVDFIEEAMDELLLEHDIFCEAIIPSELSKINLGAFEESLTSCKKVLLLEEGTNIASYSTTLVSALVQQFQGVEILSLANNNIVPSSFMAENNLLVTSDNIVNSIVRSFKPVSL